MTATAPATEPTVTSHPDVYAALEAARAEFPPITRDTSGQVGTRHYKYADLKTVMDAVVPVLRRHGLALIQAPVVGALNTELRLVGHVAENGRLSCAVELPREATSQALGSAITYARRYAIVCLLGLVTEEDDDGSQASSPRPATPPQQAPQPPAAPEGWDSPEQSVAAHNGLRDKIGQLSPEAQEACRAFRDQHGWPLTPDKFGELEEIVRVASVFVG